MSNYKPFKSKIMRLRINEAIAAAKLRGKDVKKKELAKKFFPNSTEQSRITLMTKVCSGKLARVAPEWIGIVADECGVSAEFVLGREE